MARAPLLRNQYRWVAGARHTDHQTEPALFRLHRSNAPMSHQSYLTSGEDVQAVPFEGVRLLSNHQRRLEEVKVVGDLGV